MGWMTNTDQRALLDQLKQGKPPMAPAAAPPLDLARPKPLPEEAAPVAPVAAQRPALPPQVMPRRNPLVAMGRMFGRG